MYSVGIVKVFTHTLCIMLYTVHTLPHTEYAVHAFVKRLCKAANASLKPFRTSEFSNARTSDGRPCEMYCIRRRNESRAVIDSGLVGSTIFDDTRAGDAQGTPTQSLI